MLSTINLTKQEVASLIDNEEIVTFSTKNFDYDMETLATVRTGPKPLMVEQPEGASFTIEGNAISWQGWTLRYAMHPREGLVIYQAAFEGRPVLYSASLSEMVVPYGDPQPSWYFRNAFDVGGVQLWFVGQ
ncbi:MAG: hypothetical protein HC818_00890 [Synechococcaceae cyanobacterium RM1_1_27]|nr:hypothetical protein [Synechococcaceae cyanobacterium RM1_1_27]